MYSIYNKQKQGSCMFINNFEKWIKLTFFIKKKYNIIMPNREQTPRHVHIYL